MTKRTHQQAQSTTAARAARGERINEPTPVAPSPEPRLLGGVVRVDPYVPVGEVASVDGERARGDTEVGGYLVFAAVLAFIGQWLVSLVRAAFP